MSLQVHYNDQVTFLKFIITFIITIACCLGRLVHQSAQPAHLHHFPHVLTPQTDSVWEWCTFLHIPHSCWILLNVLSNKDGRIRRRSELVFGHCAWARYSRGTNVITVFVHIPTLRIRAGCQCPRRTRSWPSSRELMGTGFTSFLSLRDYVLFCILCYTPFPMTSDSVKLSKYVHNDIG